MTPLLSVITISYEDPTGLKKTCDSLQPLLEQGIPWEHIVVDSSPKQNSKVLSQLTQNWPLVYVTEPPQGIYAAMNAGLQKATGQYLWFLNGGDHLKDMGVLKQMLDTLNKISDLDLICAAGDLMRDGKFLYVRSPRYSFLKSILGKDSLCHQATLYRHDVFKKVGPYSTEYKIAGDYDHFWRCYEKGLKVQCINERLVECDFSGVSTSSWKDSIKECRVLTKRLQPRLSPFLYFCHELGFTIERLRLHIIKSFAQTPFSKFLQPIWIWWNR